MKMLSSSPVGGTVDRQLKLEALVVSCCDWGEPWHVLEVNYFEVGHFSFCFLTSLIWALKGDGARKLLTETVSQTDIFSFSMLSSSCLSQHES